jgi:hypothetical protein
LGASAVSVDASDSPQQVSSGKTGALAEQVVNEETMKLLPSPRKTSRRVANWGATGDARALRVPDVEAFYCSNRKAVIARMRNPSSPMTNIAALVVAQCETARGLRREAFRAIAAVRRAREARQALDIAIHVYADSGDSDRVH